MLKGQKCFIRNTGKGTKVFEEHKAILKAISARDPELAEKLTTEHARNATITFMKGRQDIEST